MSKSARNSTIGAVTALVCAVATVVLVQQQPGDSPAPVGRVEQAPVSGSLAEVPVEEPGSMAGYSRDEFGAEGWPSTGDGCTLRDRILVRDSSDQAGENPGALEGGCYPTTLRMLSPYRGSVQDGEPPGPVWLDGREAVQIDHISPLAWAWRQGADEWTAAKRARFAVDPDNLVAAASSDNSSKGDAGPAEWSPEIGQCAYARQWVTVLVRYGLSVGRDDKAALAAGLREC